MTFSDEFMDKVGLLAIKAVKLEEEYLHEILVYVRERGKTEKSDWLLLQANKGGLN